MSEPPCGGGVETINTGGDATTLETMTYSKQYTDTIQTRLQVLHSNKEGYTNTRVDVDEQRKLDEEMNNLPIYEDEYCTVHELDTCTLKGSSRYVFLRMKGFVVSLPILRGYPTKVHHETGYGLNTRRVSRWGVRVTKERNCGIDPQGGEIIFVTTRSGKSWVSFTEIYLGTGYSHSWTVPFKSKSKKLWKKETQEWVDRIKDFGQPTIKSLRKVYDK